MQLQLQIVVITKDTFVPLHRLFGLGHLLVGNTFGYLATQAGRAADQSFVILLQLRAVGTWALIETFGPRLRDDLNQIVITLLILCQQYEVITTLVLLMSLIFEVERTTSHIDLATDNRLEVGHRLQLSNLLACRCRAETELLVHSLDLLDVVTQFRVSHSSLGRRIGVRIHLQQLHLAICQVRSHIGVLGHQRFERCEQLFQPFDLITLLTVLLLDIVIELLDTEHITVIGQSDAGHTVGHSLIDQTSYTRLTVKDRVLRVNV